MSETAQYLNHHWALDEQAAEFLGQQIDKRGQAGYVEAIVEQLDEKAVIQRDLNRQRIGQIFRRENGEGLMAQGPCSMDGYSDLGELFNYLEEVQEAHPNDVTAVRMNSAKPRTAGNWTGLFYATDPSKRARIFELYQQAFNRGIPIITEMTQETQLGALAPWLSGYWLGARDMASSTLRTVSSAYHMPVGVKNGLDGNPQDVRNAIKVIHSNSSDNKGSGADLGTIASTVDFPGIATGIVPVGEGNPDVAIFARGYELPEGMPAEERRERALGYISFSPLF